MTNNTIKLSSCNSTSGANNIPTMNIRKSACGIMSGYDAYQASSDATLFSSSLPVLQHEKLNLDDAENFLQSVDDITPGLNKSSENLLENVETPEIGNLLPGDEEELLAGIMDDLDLSGLPNSLNDFEDYDLFGSGGGIELETDRQDDLSKGMLKISLPDGNGMPHFALQNGVGTVAGEHPYGEHPSRTLFVRNINSNVEDSELRTLFEEYGDIRNLHTACKHRGFVMISYYDIRAARAAMRALQNKPLRRRKLDIHFSIPKDNPSEKDINQGTLVVFNLDPSVSSEDLCQIFAAYGEVKEIRETPNKKHHKFVEYYDVRAAETALKALNRRDIAGKRIKLEPSRPGGARRNLMLQLNQDFEQDDSRVYQHHVGSPLTSTSSGNWLQLSSPIDHSPLQSISKSPVLSSVSPTTSNHLPELTSLLRPQGPNSAKIAPIGNNRGRRVSHMDHLFSSNIDAGHGAAFQQSHSFPEQKLGQYQGTVPSFNSSNLIAAHRETLSGSQFLWGSPSSSVWSASSLGNQFSSSGNGQGLQYTAQQGSYQQYHHHQIGSAPSGIPLKTHFGFFPESPETSLMGPVGFGGMGAHSAISSGNGMPRNMPETVSSSFRPSPRLSPVFLGNGPYLRPVAASTMEGFSEQSRSRRGENIVNQVDSKKQFQLDLNKIISGEDSRTTLMIKNIPNKYTSKMLLAAIDEKNRGTYDFLYLPIDFKNKCNVGYAFINMLSPKSIIPFYEAFNGKKWEKFNSEKVASLAYARIQGKAALVAHFENSSLMNEDKRCRPIVFDGPMSGDQDFLQPNSLNGQASQPIVSHSADSSKMPATDWL